MSKRRDSSDGPPMKPSGSSLNWPQALTLMGLAVVIVVSIQNWNETRKLQNAFAERFGAVDNRLTMLGNQIGQGARQAQAPRGPDPNRVYQVRTDTAPAEGPKAAPITIAEFSDFQ